MQVNTNSFLFILHRCQRLSVSSFPNALGVLLFCDDDSFSSCSIAVSVLFLASLFHCSLLLSFFCFRLLHAYELVEDDVGEETIAQTSTAEQSGPLLSKWPVSMAPLSPPLPYAESPDLSLHKRTLRLRVYLHKKKHLGLRLLRADHNSCSLQLLDKLSICPTHTCILHWLIQIRGTLFQSGCMAPRVAREIQGGSDSR